MGEEKRRFIRWRKKIRVAYSFTTDGAYKEIFTEDIGEEGVQILVKDRLESHQRVRVKLEFVYDSVPIMAVGRVAYIRVTGDRYRVGLEFVDMSEFEKHRLKQCLDKLKQDDRENEKDEDVIY